MAKRRPITKHLRALGACGEARRWARPYASIRVAWAACTRPDWLIWLVGRASWGRTHGSPEHRQITLLAVLCARSTLHLIPGAPRAELESIMAQVEGWARGSLALSRDDLTALRRRAWEVRAPLWRAAADAAYAAAAAAAAAGAAAYWAARSAALRAHRAGLCRLIRAAVPCPL